MRTRSHVHSKDPRKPAIVAALKRAAGVTGGGKVTYVMETLMHYEGNVMSHTPGLGYSPGRIVKVPREEVSS